ncbi:unnamed protein product [Ectocarpus sp. CCAP 1310/34]|nr:unnamed protein product [Ectocarpus sp. CCAP 1310/34]
MPDASTGEAAHQGNKKVNHSNSGRNAAAHYARRFNMDLAIDALDEEIPWEVTRFDRRLKKYIVETVMAGSGCSAVLRSLGDDLPRGLSCAPTDARAAGTPTAAQRAAKFPGAATWTSVLWEAGSPRGNDAGGGGWESRISTGLFVPMKRR